MIVVTGGTGTVGSRLVERLLQRGEQVRVFCRNVSTAHRMFGGRAEVAQGDLGDPQSIKAALAGADRVFLLTTAAAEPGTQPRYEHNVIAAATEAGVDRIVKLSVLGADDQSPMRYARWHRQAELELAASGLDYTILRAAAFMQGFLQTAAGGSIYTCAEDGKVAMVDASDIAAVAAVVLTEDGHRGQAYSLTGPAALTQDEAAAILSAAAGREIRHVRVPPEALIQAITAAGRPAWFAEDLAVQYGLFATGEPGQGGVVSPDVAAVTGHAPRALEDFAREEFAPAGLPAAQPAGNPAGDPVRASGVEVFASSMPNIFTTDVETAAAFYRDQLGFSESLRVPPVGRPEHVVLRLGDSQVGLSTPSAVTAAGLRPVSGRSFELILWCADVDRETARLSAAGVDVVVEPYDHVGGHRRAYIADPDGNWLALVDAR